MVKMCKILYILSCFPWRVVNSVKGGMWHFFCTLHFALLCFGFALRLLCFANVRFSPGCCARKYKKPWSHTANLVCPLPSPGGEWHAVAISWNHRLRCVLGWILDA
jgi:hypothetical protein